MIKVIATSEDGTIPVLLLGLSRANVEQLLAGNMARIVGADLGIKGLNIDVIAAETEADIVTALESAGALPPDQADRMRAGLDLMDQVPATRGDVMVYRRPKPA